MSHEKWKKKQFIWYKGADPIIKLSQWWYRVQIWYATKKIVWTRIHIKQFVCNFEYLGLQKRLNIFGVKFFEVLKKKHGSVRSERQRESRQWDSEMTQKLLFFVAQPYFWNWKELKFTFSFITAFSTDKIDPKL